MSDDAAFAARMFASLMKKPKPGKPRYRCQCGMRNTRRQIAGSGGKCPHCKQPQHINTQR